MSDEEDLDLDDDLDGDSEDDAPLDLSKDKVCDLSGTYCWTKCPHCKIKNWVYLGRMDDCTAPDVQALRCFSCKALSWIDDDIRLSAELDQTTLDDAFSSDGSPAP